MSGAKTVAEKKIHHFAGFDEGWHYGEGKPPDRQTVRDAIALVEHALAAGLTDIDAFPGIDGEIMVTIYHDSTHNVDLTLERNRTVTISHECNEIEIEYQEGLTLEDAKQKATEFKAKWFKP